VLLSYKSDLPAWVGDHLHKDFAFDVETTGLDRKRDRLLGIAIRFADGQINYVALAHTEPEDGAYPLRTYMEERAVADALRPLFLQRDVVMVGHNLKFDLHFLDKIGIEVRGRLFDTMLAAQILDENRNSLSLKDLAPKEVGMHLDHYQDLVEYPGFPKDSILAVPLHKAAKYAEDDVEATWRLYEKYQVELVEEGVEWPFLHIWMPLTYTLFEMEKRGIALDIELVKQVREEYLAQAEEHEGAIWRNGVGMILDRYGDQVPANYLVPLHEKFPEIDGHNLEVEAVEHLGVVLPIFRKISKNGKIIGHPKIPWFNPNSGDQLRELIYDYHGLSLPSAVRIKPTESGKTTINADAIKVLRHALGENAPPVLDHILKLRKATKFVGTYLDRFVADADPEDWYATHTWFNQHITATGRLSSSDPNLNCRGTCG
jgi:DNA polymerase I-like protein with 3'-5' exonuclease and polymerase domains